MIEIPVPGTIKVGGFDYEILADKKSNAELRANNWLGSHSNFLQVIRLDEDTTPQHFSDTFLHEALHAVDLVYNNGSCDEKTINTLGHGLLQVFEQLGVRFVKGVEICPGK